MKNKVLRATCALAGVISFAVAVGAGVKWN